jgi:hypothetical protein
VPLRVATCGFHPVIWQSSVQGSASSTCRLKFAHESQLPLPISGKPTSAATGQTSSPVDIREAEMVMVEMYRQANFYSVAHSHLLAHLARTDGGRAVERRHDSYADGEDLAKAGAH